MPSIKVGATHGRTYDKGMNPPAFINPSAEPLRASLELQDRLKRDIRELVNLAVSSLAVRASAESKAMDNQGLEAGLVVHRPVVGKRRAADRRVLGRLRRAESEQSAKWRRSSTRSGTA